MKIRLTKKAAEMLNGVDLSRVRAGDVIDIPPRDAGMMLLSGWAVPVEEGEDASQPERRKHARVNVIRLGEAADRPPRKRRA